jgi:mannose-1-phosphate guanylyltransferase/mannose-6-phosphate isomerase
VILCGGSGTRLWPASTVQTPKPFLPLADGQSLLAATLRRVGDSTMFAPPVVVANYRQLAEIETLVETVGIGGDILLEPEARNTAAAVAAGAAFVARNDPEALLLVLAADHLIRHIAGFRATVATASAVAATGRIVVFGIRPTRPETGYGYICPGAPIVGYDAMREVKAFVEKPDLATATAYLADGFLWNSGNFLLRADVARNAFKRYAPAVENAVERALTAATRLRGSVILDAASFTRAPRISFDKAVMEHTTDAAVITAEFDWSDLGTWSAVWEAATTDAAGNATNGAVALVDTRDSLVTSDGPAVGVVGLDAVMVVAANGGILVAARSRSDDVRHLPDLLARSGGSANLETGDGYSIERMAIDPGGALPLAGDPHATRWAVARGSAALTVDGETRLLGTGSSLLVPADVAVVWANRGATPAVLVAIRFTADQPDPADES